MVRMRGQPIMFFIGRNLGLARLLLLGLAVFFFAGLVLFCFPSFQGKISGLFLKLDLLPTLAPFLGSFIFLFNLSLLSFLGRV